MALTMEEQTAGENSLTALLLVKMSGMNAENQIRQHRGQVPAYTEAAYHDLIAWFDKEIDKLRR